MTMLDRLLLQVLSDLNLSHSLLSPMKAFTIANSVGRSVFPFRHQTPPPLADFLLQSSTPLSCVSLIYPCFVLRVLTPWKIRHPLNMLYVSGLKTVHRISSLPATANIILSLVTIEVAVLLAFVAEAAIQDAPYPINRLSQNS